MPIRNSGRPWSSDGGAWLDGEAAQGFACDATITPVVTGEVDPTVLEDLVRLCVKLAGYGPSGDSAPEGSGTGDCGGPPQAAPDRDDRDGLELAIIGKTIFVLLHSHSYPDLRLLSLISKPQDPRLLAGQGRGRETAAGLRWSAGSNGSGRRWGHARRLRQNGD